jgi:hypothetical protein
MSGVTGYGPIQGRKKFESIVDSYIKELRKNPKVKDVKISGSFISNPKKTTFGDIDLIVTVDANDKKAFKKEFAEWIKSIPVQPFKGKYAGRKFYNAGELVSVAYKDAQIDNIIALSPKEAEFKLKFLNLPAEKQGLILGAIKSYFTIKDPKVSDKELQYNLSSKELQLREVIYYPGTTKEKSRKVLKSWVDWGKVEELLKDVGINSNDSFNEIFEVIETYNPRAQRRIAGVFGSMVSVKSGEVGTEKGKRKEEALKKVQNELL